MDKIERLAGEIKRRYGTDNPFDICDCMDIPVLTLPLPESVRGFFTRIMGTRIVYINEQLPGQEARVVCAHELGHALLHESLNRFFITAATFQVESRYEREADFFAVCLLLEDGRTMYERYGLSTVEQIASFTGIEERLVALRYGK